MGAKIFKKSSPLPQITIDYLKRILNFLLSRPYKSAALDYKILKFRFLMIFLNSPLYSMTK